MSGTGTGSVSYGYRLVLPLAVGVSWVAGDGHRRAGGRAPLPAGRRQVGAHQRTKNDVPHPDPSSVPVPRA
jgi:hypothetical protein